MGSYGRARWAGSPRGTFGRRTARTAVGFAASVALVAGCSSSGQHAGASASGQVAWAVGIGARILGTWVTPDDVVVATAGALTAYSIGSGSVDWTWKPPSGESVCGLSPSTVSGLGAFDYGSGGTQCTHLQEIDVVHGTLYWANALDLTDTAGPGNDVPDSGREIDLNSTVTVAPEGQDGLLEADTTTGLRMWGAASGTLSCARISDSALVGSYIYMIVDGCGQSTVLADRPTSGTKNGTSTTLPSDCSTAGEDALISADDAHLLVACGVDTGKGHVYSLAPGAGRLVPLGASADAMEKYGEFMEADAIGVDAVQQKEFAGNFTASSDLLYLPAQVGSDSGGSTKPSEIVAANLDTGAQQWTASVPNSEDGLTVFGADESGVNGLAYSNEDMYGHAQDVSLFHLGATGGATTELAVFTGAGASALVAGTGVVHAAIEGKHLVVVTSDSTSYTLAVLRIDG